MPAKTTKPHLDDIPADELALLVDDDHAEPRPYDDDTAQENGL